VNTPKRGIVDEKSINAGAKRRINGPLSLNGAAFFSSDAYFLGIDDRQSLDVDAFCLNAGAFCCALGRLTPSYSASGTISAQAARNDTRAALFPETP